MSSIWQNCSICFEHIVADPNDQNLFLKEPASSHSKRYDPNLLQLSEEKSSQVGVPDKNSRGQCVKLEFVAGCL